MGAPKYDRQALAHIFPKHPHRQAAPAARRYGMVANRSIGSYSTPDGIGHIERNGRQWDAWRDDTPGITAHYSTMRAASQYAHHGYSDED